MSGGGEDPSVGAGRALPPGQLLERWREDRRRLVDHARTVDPRARVPWYGPAMGARSFITARLMETWAHGQDVADALGVERTPTDRLRHVAHIGVGARAFSYLANGREPSQAPVRVELVAPSGDIWSWGPEDAPDRVTGPALGFCLLVTQRRHRDDVGLTAEGAAADEWLDIAQSFAGPPGEGRHPRPVRLSTVVSYSSGMTISTHRPWSSEACRLDDFVEIVDVADRARRVPERRRRRAGCARLRG